MRTIFTIWLNSVENTGICSQKSHLLRSCGRVIDSACLFSDQNSVHGGISEHEELNSYSEESITEGVVVIFAHLSDLVVSGNKTVKVHL